MILGVSRRDGRRSSGSTRSPLTNFSPPEFRCFFVLPSPSQVSPRLAQRGRPGLALSASDIET